MRYGLWNDPAECLHVNVSFLLSFVECNCILQASCLIRSVILFKISTDRVLNYIQNSFSSHVGLMHTSLQLCDVGRAVCGLYFRDQEIELLTGCFLCLSQWLGPGLLLLLLLGFFPFLFVMDPEALFVREHSLLSRCWVLATEFTHIIRSGASGGIQAHRSITASLSVLGSVSIVSKALLSPRCVWKKRVIPSVPTDRNQGQEQNPVFPGMASSNQI